MDTYTNGTVVALAALALLAALIGPRAIALFSSGGLTLGAREQVVSVVALEPMRVMLRVARTNVWAEASRELAVAELVVKAVDGSESRARFEALTVLDESWHAVNGGDDRGGVMVFTPRADMLLQRRGQGRAIVLDRSCLRARRARAQVVAMIAIASAFLSIAHFTTLVSEPLIAAGWLAALLATRLLGKRAWFEGGRIEITNAAYEQRLARDSDRAGYR